MLYLGLWWDRWHPEATSRPVLLLDEKLRSGLRSGQRRPLGRDRTAQSGLYSAEESVSVVLKCKKRYYVISAVLSTEGVGVRVKGWSEQEAPLGGDREKQPD